MKRFLPWLFELVAIVLIIVTFLIFAFSADNSGGNVIVTIFNGGGTILAVFILECVAILINLFAVINHSFLYKKYLSKCLDYISCGLFLTSASVLFVEYSSSHIPALISAGIVLSISFLLMLISSIIRTLPIKKY